MTDPVSGIAQNSREPQNTILIKSEFLHPSRVVCDLDVASRKRLFEEFSELIACTTGMDPGADEEYAKEYQPGLEQIFETLHDRERLGSTGLGKGIALPHGRIEGLSEPVIAIAKLRNPIDYDSPDGLPVWLAVCLLVPDQANEVHLNLLAALAALFSDNDFVRTARSINTPAEMYNLFAVV